MADVTTTDPLGDRMPPLRPWVAGSKISISCEKPREFLMRAWAPSHYQPQQLVDWVCHYIGRLNMDGLEWWGYTYGGQPSYMGRSPLTYASGLTYQRFAAPEPGTTLQRMLDEGKVGPTYLAPQHLAIPKNGVVQPGLADMGPVVRSG